MGQEFEEMFYQIYDVVSEDVKNDLKKVKSITRKYIGTAIIVAILGTLAVYTLNNTRVYTVFVVALSLIVIGILVVGSRQIYRKKYKTSVIKAILKKYMDTLDYDPTKGFSVAKYREYGLDQGFNDYYSEDQIKGYLPTAESVTVAEVRTKVVEEIRDNNGYTQRNEKQLFHGMFGEVELHRPIPARISLDIDSFMRKFSKDRIEVDSHEFESYFDLSADNRLFAMQIFTSEMIEKILEIKNVNKHYNYELKIIGNKLIFRYSCGDLFEPPVFGVGISRDRVKEYFRNIYYPFEILKSLVENINYANDVEIKNIDI